MGKIKGIDVEIIGEPTSEVDPFGKYKKNYSNPPIIVHNVLVAPASTEDVVNQLNLTGKKVVYTLAIPKGDMNNWVNAEVFFFNEYWRTVGLPQEGIEDLIPLEWNKKVMVERYV